MADYIDNTEFYNAIVERKEQIRYAEENGLPIPKLTNYLGSCILLIANNFASKANFNGYSFKDEMISDAVENCVKYFDKFDHLNYKNPFAYFSQFVYFAFLRRIAREKQEFKIKHKIIQSVGNKVLELQDHDEDGEFINSYREYLKEFSNVNLEPEKVKPEKVKPTKPIHTSTMDILYGDAA